MTRRHSSRPDRTLTPRHQLPAITYRHIPAPTAPTLTMDRSIYTSNRRPSTSSRTHRSSSHNISRRADAHHDSTNHKNDSHHRTLTMRPHYADRSSSNSKNVYEPTGIRGTSSVIICPTPQNALSASYALDPRFAGAFVDDLPTAAAAAAAAAAARRGAEVYEVPLSPYAASDFDAGSRRGGGGGGGGSSAQTSRPSSRGSEYGYTEYEDDEERERKRFLGSELYGYVMAMRLKERLVDVRQVLNLYKDFDRVSGGIFIFHTQKDFLEMIRQAIEATRDVEKPLRRWAQSGKGKTERGYYTHKLLETSSELIKLWQKRLDWIRTRSDELLYVHGAKGNDKRHTYATRREKCIASADEALMLLKPREMDEVMEGVQELGDRLKGGWRRDGRLSADEMIRKKGYKWGTKIVRGQ